MIHIVSQCISTTVAYATSFFKSVWKKSLKTESVIPISRKGYTYINVGSNCSVIKHFNKPKKANLTNTPLRKIEKLVEAST